MDSASLSGKAVRYFHTIRYLKPEQFFFRLYYRLRGKLKKTQSISADKNSVSRCDPVILLPFIPKNQSCKEHQFTFLNLSEGFDAGRIDWNFSGYGKLWTYNLNYFDFLLQPGMNASDGMLLIHEFIKELDSESIGLEPYPTSLRGINWIKFFSRHDIRDDQTDRSLYAQYSFLARSLEYHLLGNHLLENAFSMLFAAFYFHEQGWFDKSRKLLLKELEEQILDDGGHFELSPMYHQILLDRLLDCINLLQENERFEYQSGLLDFMRRKALLMLAWLSAITLPDISIPHLNDATNDIAPSSGELFLYAERLGLGKPGAGKLSDSGYRRFDGRDYTCLVDVGSIGPDYIPGHAHADTFNFVLHVHGKPLIVDTGISTYEKNDVREQERSTSAHNTVVVNGMNSSDVWGGFRAGKRARVRLLEDAPSKISAMHDGYRAFGVKHTRSWEFATEGFSITDAIQGITDMAVAYLHFENGIEIRITGSSVEAGSTRISFDGAEEILLRRYRQAIGYNKCVDVQLLAVSFRERLVTSIRC